MVRCGGGRGLRAEQGSVRTMRSDHDFMNEDMRRSCFLRRSRTHWSRRAARPIVSSPRAPQPRRRH